VGHAEDDHDASGGCPSGVHESHDAVDDAVDVWVLHDNLSQRARDVLDRIQRCWDRNSGLRDRLGSFAQPVQTQAGPTGSCD